MLQKGNILQYKNNSSNFTKKQIYSQIARGKLKNGNKTWATQSDTFTNPNINSLQRNNYTNIALNGTVTNNPITCSSILNNIPGVTSPANIPVMPQNNNTGTTNSANPILPSTPSTSSQNNSILPTTTGEPIAPNTSAINPVSVSNNTVVPNGGNLISNTLQNICTGAIITYPVKKMCNPTTDSNVPGKIINLCYDSSLQSYNPRIRRVMNAGLNKWPQGAKNQILGNNVVFL